MPHPRVRLAPTDAEIPGGVLQALRDRFAAVRAELGLSLDYPADALAEAEQVAAAPPDLPGRTRRACRSSPSTRRARWTSTRRCTSSATVTGTASATPSPTSRPSSRPGGALDRVTRERGQTVYCPDVRVPLHPQVLSEAAASLLPDAVRPAFVWDLRLDGDGVADRGRGLPRDGAQRRAAGLRHGAGGGRRGHRRRALPLLHEIGERRIAQERARGGASLPMPEQQVTARDGGGFTLEFRPPVPAEEWNAQVSLLTGMAAAEMMLDAGVGVLRTMPAPTDDAVARFRRAARGLGVEWPEDMPYGDLVRGLDRTNPRHLALIHEATALFRGAGYTAFDGEAPEQPEHAAVAAPYAHVTAPLRRLVDRFGLVVCEARAAGREVPDAVRAALPPLPELMPESDRRARAAERACADATEAAVLHGREGEDVPGRSSSTTPTRGWPCSSSTCRSWPGSAVERAALGDETGRGSRVPTCEPASSSSSGPDGGRRGPGRHPAPLHWSADESGGRSRRWETTAEEGPGSEGQDGGQQPPGATRGTVPQRTDRPWRASGGARVKRWCKRPPAAWVTRSAR